MKQMLLGVGAVVILVVAGWLYFSRSGDVEVLTTFELQGVSLATGEDVTANYTDQERPPLVCPTTGERSVYPWFVDPVTKRRFVPQLVPQPDGPPKLPMIPVSPDGNTGQPYYPQDWGPEVGEELGEDYPLPEWPVTG